jgi:hypothetical protein
MFWTLAAELMMLFMNFYFHDDILLGFENDVFPPTAATASSATVAAPIAVPQRFDEIFDNVPK